MNTNQLDIALVRFSLAGGTVASDDFKALLFDFDVDILDVCLRLQHIEHNIKLTLAGFPENI